jgi:hypothetical protein
MMEEIKQEIKKQKPKKERMSQDDAFKLIKEWGDSLEVRLLEDDFEEVQKEIWKAVQMERLVFNESDETFTYVLKKPIKDINEKEVAHSQLKIKECQMRDKKELEKYKKDFETAVATIKVYCTDMEGEEIQMGFLERLYDRDIQVLNAIILGFFVQAIPQAK